MTLRFNINAEPPSRKAIEERISDLKGKEKRIDKKISLARSIEKWSTIIFLSSLLFILFFAIYNLIIPSNAYECLKIEGFLLRVSLCGEHLIPSLLILFFLPNAFIFSKISEAFERKLISIQEKLGMIYPLSPDKDAKECLNLKEAFNKYSMVRQYVSLLDRKPTKHDVESIMKWAESVEKSKQNDQLVSAKNKEEQDAKKFLNEIGI